MRRTLVLTCGILFHLSLSAQEGIKGSWSGELTGVAAGVELIFHITDSNDVWACTMDVPSQGLTDYPASSVLVSGDSLAIGFDLLQASFDGYLVSQTGPLLGTWRQSGLEIGFRLDRLPNKPPGRPQDPGRPFPYEEVELTFLSADKESEVKLAGTLTYPKNNNDTLTAVILVSGSGPQDRNEAIMGHRPFLVLSDALTRSGFAVLRYDDRGVAESSGEFATATTADFVNDALGGIEYLRRQSFFPAGKVGVIGHSEGGMVATMLAAKQKVDLAILMAAPGIPCDELMLQQVLALNLIAGATEEMIAQDTNYAKQVYALIKSTPLDQELDTSALRTLAQDYYDLSPVLRQRFSSVDAFYTSQLATVGSPWFRYFIQYEPAGWLRQVRCPILAINGGKDLQVIGQNNLPAIQQVLMEVPGVDGETRLFPDLNHLFQPAETGAISEYSKIDVTIAPAVIDKIVQWLGGR